MRTEDFNFFLPEHLIAQHPTQQRSASRLLRLNNNSIQDDVFSNIVSLLNAGDVLLLNDTKVIKARLFGQKLTGGQIEVLVERVINNHEAYAQIKSSRSPLAGSRLILENNIHVEVLGRQDDMFHLKFLDDASVYDLLECYGHLPLPPYITHNADTSDETRYQTVFAKNLGAVAAPTAGLHFDEPILQKLRDKGISIEYVTLHVGAGTFQPVRVDDISQHKMHSERYEVPAKTIHAIQEAKQHQKRVIAVGTTVLRTLESAALTGVFEFDTPPTSSLSGETQIFITPGFIFKVVDVLITNFHLPKSTLMMLVSAFAGIRPIQAAYKHAIQHSYRFFSYGDAMMLHKQINAEK